MKQSRNFLYGKGTKQNQGHTKTNQDNHFDYVGLSDDSSIDLNREMCLNSQAFNLNSDDSYGWQ